MGEDVLDVWFKREVVIHDNALTGYLRRCWPNPDDIHDLPQLERVRRSGIDLISLNRGAQLSRTVY